MKYWPEILIAISAAIIIILAEPNRALAEPVASIDDNKFVSIPTVQSSDGRLWEAKLQCNQSMTECLVVFVKEVCQPGLTRFSPSFCWEFGR